VELFHGTELVEELLVDQPRDQEELVVGHELVDDLLLHALGLQRRTRDGSAGARFGNSLITCSPSGPAQTGGVTEESCV